MSAKKTRIKIAKTKRGIVSKTVAKKLKRVAKAPPKKAARKTPIAAVKRKSSVKKQAAKTPEKRTISPQTLVKPARLRSKAMVDLGDIWKRVPHRKPHTIEVTVRRPDDLLVCDIVFQNLILAGGTKPKLVKKTPSLPAWMVVEFPPQCFGEEAFLDATGEEVTPGTEFKEVTDDPAYPKKNTTNAEAAEVIPPLPAARVRMSGCSRVAYEMPAKETELGFNIEDVLKAMRSWQMRLDVNAAPESKYKHKLDRAWLKELNKNLIWKDATASIIGELENLGAQGFKSALSQASKRIADQSAQALARGDTRGLKQRLQRLMRAELTRLSSRYAPLKKKDTQSIATAALSMMASKDLAASKRKFELSAETISQLPFLAVPLAPHEPAASVTAIELPYRLILSPITPARWMHKESVVEHRGRTELWHTRLTTAGLDFGPDETSKIRAIWSPDYPIEDVLPLLQDPVKPYRMSLDPLDRKMLVNLMANYGQYQAGSALLRYIPEPSDARRLMLSSLGGLLDAEGSWDPSPKMIGLEQWRHLATLGRDHYVRVVYAGFLYPFGHAATLIKVTERKFENHDPLRKKNRIAVLRQRFFIVVREKFKQFAGEGHTFNGRNFPFSSVEILTRITPNLRAPEKPECTLQAKAGDIIYTNVPEVPPRAAFWPMISSQSNFMFELAATDLGGLRNTFSMPLLFIGVEANQTRAEEVINAYNLATDARRQTTMGGASVCYAPLKTNAKGDPRLPTETVLFNADLSTVTADKPRCYPQIETAEVGIRAVQRLLGRNDAVVKVKYPDVYKLNGFTTSGGANPGELFLELTQPQGYPLEFGEGGSKCKSDSIGALVTPAMAIQGLSRIMGPASDLANIANNQFKAEDFFKNANPKILGGISLLDLLSGVKALTSNDVPKMVSRELPDKLEASYEWQTTITSSSTDLFVPTAGGQSTELQLQTTAITPLANPDETTFNSLASLTNFKVNLFGFIIIWFDRLKFDAKQGSKPDVIVEFHPGDDAVEFGGPLEFINQLRSLIPSDGFSDPPDISVTPSGISAGYSVNLPAVQVGVFALTNASLGASFALPFDARPMLVRFNFSERQQPFSLTVSMLGGGGFFALAVGSEGVREIEASLEFGAGVSIDLVVASGSVEIKAGIYFHWLESGNQGTVEFAGFVRMHGELSVLGLISASLTFNLQLVFLKDEGAHKSIVWGEATLVVEIDLLIFSADVSVKCRREFANSESDPRFIDLIPDEATWSIYCDAFAEEAA